LQEKGARGLKDYADVKLLLYALMAILLGRKRDNADFFTVPPCLCGNTSLQEKGF
jgi:hypothetical protein